MLPVVILIVLAAGGGAWAATRSSGSASTTATSLVAVTSQTLRQAVTASGTIEPASEANLSFSVSGTVISVPASVGAAVAKGAVLATVGSADLAAAVSSAQANLAAANLGLSAASSATATQLAAAQAQVLAAQDKLAAAQQSLAAATLTSPIAGTVAAVSIAVGDQVGNSSSGASSGGLSSGSAAGAGGSNGTGSAGSSGVGTASTNTAQIVVISTGSWVVDASVGSADLAQVKKGLQVEISPTGSTAKVFGVVSSVGIVASSANGGTATFPVSVAVTGQPSGLYAGGSASVTIIVKQLQNVLTVPTEAVHTVGGQTVVYERSGGKQINVPVTVGAVFGPNTQIMTGTKAGDEVVVSRPTGVRGGVPTRGQNGGGTAGNGAGRNGTGAGFGGGGGFGGGFGRGGTG